MSCLVLYTMQPLFTTGVLLRAASLSLHRATGGRVHLASVTLAIPRHWPRRPGVKQVPYDPLSKADIRIVDDGPGSLWPQLQAPVAQRVAACGQPGERVMFPMAALPMDSSSSYQLAREWARYRYGVLGEFAATGDVWYAEDACNGTFPAACTNSSENASGGERWGDKPCDPMSAWQLITGSDDFKGLRSRNDNEPIVTTFRQIQQNESIGRHLIMVFDVSDTDKDDVTVTKLKETVAFVLVDKLAQGALVSLVYFFNGSSFHAGPMTLIKASKTDITRLVLLAPMQGPTCTLCALRMTLQVGKFTETLPN
ncbi:hypothetical protein HPB51_000395 [Rhipicephalus microplus]|uniref:Calcium-activated chloride channel N-terminal domain-containing protein n=1 Tax=Rhipicephalus microplus TaxID=6941 RepID=A0A9J6DS30_RHIMP|nr:hypothetical protein HPB51_000395 [Rhipicephalus microplus]